jgi:hypothetical protein
MSSPTPLKGIELIDCAKANAKQGLETASNLCGYSEDLNLFKQELHQACQNIGVEISELSDLITDQPMIVTLDHGIEVAPDTPSDL